MKKEVVTSFGEQVTVCRTDSGNILCPICGYEYPDSASWYTARFLGSQEFCDSCNTQMGVHDIGDLPPDPHNLISKRWAVLRRKWLDNEQWPEWAVRQVIQNLDIDRSSLSGDRLLR